MCCHSRACQKQGELWHCRPVDGPCLCTVPSCPVRRVAECRRDRAGHFKSFGWITKESMFDKNDAKIEQERAEAEEKRQRTRSSFSETVEQLWRVQVFGYMAYWP